MGAIYSLRFPGSSRRYVGSTKSVKNRESSHRSLLRKGTHACRALQNAAWKYGLENMIVEILQEDVRIEWLVPSEQHWLDHYAGQLYNRLTVAAGRAPEAKRPFQQHLIGNQHRKGIPHSAADKARISAGLKRAFAEGRRHRTDQDNFRRFREAVSRGAIPHPAKRKRAYILDVLTKLADNRSVALTARAFSMTTANVNIIVKNAMADIEAQASAALGKSAFERPKRGSWNKLIHPDWFEFIGDEQCLTT